METSACSNPECQMELEEKKTGGCKRERKPADAVELHGGMSELREC